MYQLGFTEAGKEGGQKSKRGEDCVIYDTIYHCSTHSVDFEANFEIYVPDTGLQKLRHKDFGSYSTAYVSLF
jgi:hypothetical protein